MIVERTKELRSFLAKSLHAILPPMTEIARTVRTTQAAEGHPRWRWTTAELLHLKELGAFNDEDRFELIGGEIVPTSPNGRRHEVLREDLEEYLRQRLSKDIRVVAEPQLNLSEDTYTKPDILVRPVAILTPDIRGDTTLLVIEIADTRLAYDLGTKAARYAAHGVAEYWVINARTLETKVHRDPTPEGYPEPRAVPATETVVPLMLPGLAVRLADLDRK